MEHLNRRIAYIGGSSTWRFFDWILLDEGMDHWRVVLNAIMSVRFPYEVGNVVTLRGAVISSDGILAPGSWCRPVQCIYIYIYVPN